MLIRYPRMVRAGSVVDPMVTNLDIAPTFLELAGVDVPRRMQGLSMVPFLKGEKPKTWRKDWLYEYYEYPGPHNVPEEPRAFARTGISSFIITKRRRSSKCTTSRRTRANFIISTAIVLTPGWPADLRRRLAELRQETDDHYVYPAAARARVSDLLPGFVRRDTNHQLVIGVIRDPERQGRVKSPDRFGKGERLLLGQAISQPYRQAFGQLLLLQVRQAGNVDPGDNDAGFAHL